ncbi:hypothetical protein RHMOL_Rhmol13G0296200 [Rhododendron molle]|uniref:Uncharacterized protein n=1 Tax=Rhododendron molle TaxID=49168 RepID=A0ACC0LCI1_RHOML|nr:hypothetical protein RHMOL_Rhmol13G0296200 [Rhododendron molle]
MDPGPASEEERLMLKGGRSFISSPPAFSNDAKKLLICTGNTVSVFSTSTGLQITELEGHTALVSSIVIAPASTPSSKILCFCWTASLDGTIRHWDFSVPELMKKIDIRFPIYSMVIPSLFIQSMETQEKTHDIFAYVSTAEANQQDKKPNALHGKIRKCNLTKSRLAGGVTLAETPKPEFISICSSGNYFGIQDKRKIRIWNVPAKDSERHDIKKIRLHHTKKLTTLAFHPTKRIVAAGDVTGRILIWRGFGNRAFSLSDKRIKEALTSNDDDRPGVRGDDDADSCTTWHWHSAEVKLLLFSSDGAYLYSGGKEGVLVVWQLDTGKKKFLPRIGSPLQFFTTSLDPSLSSVSCADNRIHLLKMPSMEILKSIAGIKLRCSVPEIKGSCSGFAFDYTSGLVAVCAENYCIQLYSLFDDREISQVQICERNHQPGDELTREREKGDFKAIYRDEALADFSPPPGAFAGRLSSHPEPLSSIYHRLGVHWAFSALVRWVLCVARLGSATIDWKIGGVYGGERRREGRTRSSVVDHSTQEASPRLLRSSLVRMIVSVIEEDDDSADDSDLVVEMAIDNIVRDATMVSMVTTDAWPKLGTFPELKTPAKAAEHGAGVILTPPQGPSPRPLSVVARIPPVPVDKSEGEDAAWTKQKILLTNEVKIGRLSKHLKKVPIVYENGRVMIPTNISEIGALKWKNAIVGCFVDKRLSYFQVRSWAQRVWKTDAKDVITLDNGFFVYKFRDTETLDSILVNGPYFCGGKRIVIKKWHPGMHLTKGAFSSVPVWVKLYNVPLESWTEDGLNYIASYSGNPLYLDDFMQNHSRLTFSRVCIEVEAAKEIPKSFLVNLGYGEPYEIRVEVPWKPQACNTCKIFCHTTNACTIQPQAPPSQVWKAKVPVGQEIPVAQEQIFKERVGNVDNAWEEVKKKKDHRSPPSMPLVTPSPCHSGASSDVLRIDDMGNVPPSVMTSSSFDVLKSCDTNDHSSVADQVSPIVPIHSQAEVPVAPRRSTRFRKPPRIPLEGDFVGPRHGSNQLVMVTLVALSLDGCVMSTVETRLPEEGIGGLVSLKFWTRGQQDKDFSLSTVVYEPHWESDISAVAFHPSSRMAVSSSYGGDFKVWIRNHEIRRKDQMLQKTGWTCHAVGSYKKKPLTAAAFSADGSVLAVAAETVITLWDPEKNVLVAVIGDSLEPIESLSFLGKSEHLVSTSRGSNPQVSVWSMSKLSVSWSYKLHAEAVTCSLDDSSFAVLARLPESSKFTESNETSLQSKDGAILLFNVGDPVPVATWFVEKSRGGGLSFLHTNRASSEDKISGENSASVLLAYLNGDCEYVVFNPYGEQEGGIAHRRSIVGLEETGQIGYSSIYGELSEFELKRNQTQPGPFVPSERPWETIFSGPSHSLPPLTKLCSSFLESLLEKRTVVVE